VLVGDLLVTPRAGQIPLDDSQLKLLAVLRHAPPKKSASNFWGSVHGGAFFIKPIVITASCGAGILAALFKSLPI